jgi:hypothetical protein
VSSPLFKRKREIETRKRRPYVGRTTRDLNLWRKYKIGESEFQELLEKQAGRCAICGVVPDKTLVVDHRHSDDAIRGLLCDDCNQGLGRFKDNPALLQSAISYLATRK